MCEVLQDNFAPVTINPQMMSRINYIGVDALSIYVYLYAGANLDEFSLSVCNISKQLQIARNRVLRAIDKLEFLHYISISKNFKKVSQYYIMPGIKNDEDFVDRYKKYLTERTSIWYSVNFSHKKKTPVLEVT